MFPCFTLLLALICCCGASTRAQEAAKPPAPVVAPDAFADEEEAYNTLYNRGFFDELIFKTNQRIAEMGDKPDPRLFYWRGWAYYKLGWFDLAETDLNAARIGGAYAGSKKFASVMNGLNSMTRLKVLMPPNMQEIGQGERVQFQMHYSKMGDGAAKVKNLLPTAYRINREMFGTDVEAMPVYVFDTYEQFRAFNKELAGHDKIGNWVWGIRVGASLLIALQYPDGSSASIGSVIVHEINHVMLSRLSGGTKQPYWFIEGIAQVAQAQIDPAFASANQRALKQLFANNALVPIEKISSGNGYIEQTELGISMRKGGDSQAAPNPYAQSYGMIKYLLDNISTAQLQSFLNRNRESGDFNSAFQDEFGFTVEQFYEMWKRDHTRQLGL